MIHILALCIGAVAGVRIFLPLAALAWAAYFGWFVLSGASSILAMSSLKWILSAFSVGEMLYRLRTPKVDGVLWKRIPLHILGGAVAGATVGGLADVTAIGAFGGLVGAAVGFFPGILANKWLFASTGSTRVSVLVLDGFSLLALFFIAAALS